MASGTNRMATGVGAAASQSVDATEDGTTGETGPNSSQGEVGGAGSIYSAQLNERPNISNPRNQGPVRNPSMLGRASMPVVTASQRHTGKIS